MVIIFPCFYFDPIMASLTTFECIQTDKKYALYNLQEHLNPLSVF